MKKSLPKRFEHGIKLAVAAVSSFFMKKGRTDFETIDPRSIRRVLFIRPEKLGDMVISLPVFHNLKKQYPHLELYTISSPRNIAIVEKDARIVRNYLYTKRLFHDLDMIRQVRRLNVDAVVDMVCDDSVTALFLAQLSSPRAWRVGVGKNRHRRYYDFNYGYRTDDESHVLDNTLKLLTAFGIETDRLERHVPPTIPGKSRKTADEYFASFNSGEGGNIIGINISAGRPARVWQMQKNEALIGEVLENYSEYQVVVTSEPRERDRAVALAGRFPARVYPLPPELDLLEVSAIISRMKLLVTPDTSLVHIARAFKVPVIGLYTMFDRNFRLWKPYNQKGGTVVSGNDYNIFDIEVDEVYEEVTALLPPN